MESRYRIYWSTSTGVTGHGTAFLELELADAWLNHLNTEYPDMSHWLERCKEST